MSESDNKPTLGRRPLGLKTSVEAGEVKQTFSHGRTNKVVVEVKRRKLIGKPGEAPPAPPPAPEPVLVVEALKPAPRPAPAPSAESRQEMQARDGFGLFRHVLQRSFNPFTGAGGLDQKALFFPGYGACGGADFEFTPRLRIQQALEPQPSIKFEKLAPARGCRQGGQVEHAQQCRIGAQELPPGRKRKEADRAGIVGFTQFHFRLHPTQALLADLLGDGKCSHQA